MDAKAGSAMKLLGLLAPTPREAESLLQKGFGLGGLVQGLAFREFSVLEFRVLLQSGGERERERRERQRVRERVCV